VVLGAPPRARAGVSALAAALAAAAAAGAPALFFDDFSQNDRSELAAQGWQLRDSAGHPGVPGARWAPEGVELRTDPAMPGQRVLALHARTDGSPEGTQQSQLCRPQQFLWGTTSARVRFADQPLAGADGDTAVQAVFQVSPLRFDYDPLFSELDWEYLPNGGWGSPDTRLYGIAWQTVKLDPWDAHNLSHEQRESFGGRWVQLTTQSTPQGSRWFIDGKLVATHAGRTVPRQPMALALSHWFSPSGLLPRSAGVRHYAYEVDWVLHVADQPLSPQQMLQQVQALREQGMKRVDQMPAAKLPRRCDF
jgi:hypothetical protein